MASLHHSVGCRLCVLTFSFSPLLVRRVLSLQELGVVREHAVPRRGRSPQDDWHHWHGVRGARRAGRVRRSGHEGRPAPPCQDPTHCTPPHSRRIGTEVAHRARGFHMNILYHNRSRRLVRREGRQPGPPRPGPPRPGPAAFVCMCSAFTRLHVSPGPPTRTIVKEAEEELGATYAGLEDVLRQSDYVVLTCPCTPETTNLIGSSQLQLMKVGRQPCVSAAATTCACTFAM